MGRKEMKGISLNYDTENDVLYLYFEKVQEAVSREIADGVFVRLDPNTDQVVGVTILDLQKKSLEDRGIKFIPIDKTFLEART
ncbi:MAG: DUF2283 domain-containing protein [candidate division NC10 bacterium]|nr:DUF2283 domain-containing protein [candidate division NC10 bacterium]